MVQPSLRAAVSRIVAGALLLFSLVSLVSYGGVLLDTRPWTTFGANPLGATLNLAFSLALLAMFVGIIVVTVGVVTETYGRHRRTYLRVMRVCGAVGLVGVGGVLLSAVAGAL